MTKEEFIKRINKVEARLVREWEEANWTDGLCEYINRHVSCKARESFQKRFRLFSPHRKNTYWLGDTRSKEGYKTRLKYIAKFKAYSLRFWRYRRY